MVINKEAKVFGKINIIDLLIILAILAVGVFFASRLRAGEITIAPTPTSAYEMRFFTESVQTFTAENMRVGEDLFDNATGALLGRIVEVNINPSIEWNPNAAGVLTSSSMEGWSSVEVVTHLQATPDTHGIRISGNRYSVGQSLTIRGGGLIFLRVSGIEER